MRSGERIPGSLLLLGVCYKAEAKQHMSTNVLHARKLLGSCRKQTLTWMRLEWTLCSVSLNALLGDHSLFSVETPCLLHVALIGPVSEDHNRFCPFPSILDQNKSIFNLWLTVVVCLLNAKILVCSSSKETQSKLYYVHTHDILHYTAFFLHTHQNVHIQ